MKNENPILDELHQVRQRLLAESGGTLSGLVSRLQEQQKRSDRELISPRRQLRHRDAVTREEAK
jgi:hypothetical protein